MLQKSRVFSVQEVASFFIRYIRLGIEAGMETIVVDRLVLPTQI